MLMGMEDNALSYNLGTVVYLLDLYFNLQDFYLVYEVQYSGNSYSTVAWK